MSKKKSYMNISNVINEGILDKIFDFIKANKVKKLEKAWRNQPAIKKKIQKVTQLSKDLEKEMNKSGYTWKPSEGGWVSKDGKKVNI